MTKAPVKHLIFDMGGVLLNIHWHQQVSRLLQKDIPFEQIHKLWGDSQATRAFETGKLDFEDFTRSFIEEFNLKIRPAEFQQAFRAIIAEDFAGSAPLLEKLRPHYTLSLLSNTNACHWRIMVDRNSFLPLLHHHFTSLELGVMKPDPAIYKAVLARLEASPEQTLFFDDGMHNVEAARALGMKAEQVFGPDDIQAALLSHGLKY